MRSLVQLTLVAQYGDLIRYRRTVVSDAMIVDAGRRLAAAARSPARVLLFGSRARGDAREDSDLDFLVIEEHLDSKLSEMVRLRDALPPLDVPVDVVVVSEEEVARRSPVPSTLVHRALREGRVLVPS
jgi:predicted nucleotidyltransferase